MPDAAAEVLNKPALVQGFSAIPPEPKFLGLAGDPYAPRSERKRSRCITHRGPCDSCPSDAADGELEENLGGIFMNKLFEQL